MQISQCPPHHNFFSITRSPEVLKIKELLWVRLFSELDLRIFRCKCFVCVLSVCVRLLVNIFKGIQNIWVLIHFHLLIIGYFCGKEWFGNKTPVFNIVLTGSACDCVLCKCLLIPVRLLVWVCFSSLFLFCCVCVRAHARACVCVCGGGGWRSQACYEHQKVENCWLPSWHCQ
jgi:hypothetical protein